MMRYPSLVLLCLLIAVVTEGAIDKNWYKTLINVFKSNRNIEICLDKEIRNLKQKLNVFSTDYCNMYLISGYGRDTSVMSASSSNHNVNEPQRGILNTEYNYKLGLQGAWSAKTNRKNDFLQVELPFMSWMTGIATQGRNSQVNKQWVTSYRVMYSIDCKKWKTIGKGNGQVFTGNSDQNSIKKNLFATPIKAKCVRVNPVSYHVHKSMRMEVIGCKY